MTTDALRSITENLWVAERPLPLIVGDIGARMTVIRLPSGGLWLHSPIRLDEPTRAALDALGPVEAVVAPSLAHHLFAGGYPKVYPDAGLYGAPGLDRKRENLRFTAMLGDEAPAAWQGTIDQLVFGGAPLLNEVVFFHRPSATLILTDLAFNVPADGTKGARVFHWLVGSKGKFGPHRIIRTAIRDRAAAREQVGRMLAWDFDRVIVSHGEVLETGGHAALERAFAFL
ncbi:DUF4336 domain-containing protein [Nannocystaceae bacterium ST9]